jgi:hypothetical protein
MFRLPSSRPHSERGGPQLLCSTQGPEPPVNPGWSWAWKTLAVLLPVAGAVVGPRGSGHQRSPAAPTGQP